MYLSNRPVTEIQSIVFPPGCRCVIKLHFISNWCISPHAYIGHAMTRAQFIHTSIKSISKSDPAPMALRTNFPYIWAICYQTWVNAASCTAQALFRKLPAKCLKVGIQSLVFNLSVSSLMCFSLLRCWMRQSSPRRRRRTRLYDAVSSRLIDGVNWCLKQNIISRLTSWNPKYRLK